MLKPLNPEQENEFIRLRRKHIRLSHERDILYSDYIKGEVPKDEYLDLVEDINVDIELCHEHMKALRDR